VPGVCKEAVILTEGFRAFPQPPPIRNWYVTMIFSRQLLSKSFSLSAIPCYAARDKPRNN
jgi:hypothetical protein